jgi:hypothetical protein
MVYFFHFIILFGHLFHYAVMHQIKIQGHLKFYYIFHNYRFILSTYKIHRDSHPLY